MATVIEGVKLYTVRQAAEELNVTPQTIRTWINQGKLKAQAVGRCILLTEGNLKDFLYTKMTVKEKLRYKVRIARSKRIIETYGDI